MTSEEFINRERDIREAHIMFPDIELGAAYLKFMKEVRRAESIPNLRTDDETIKAAKAVIIKAFKRPCTQSGCSGEQVLSGVCEGCAAGKKGFKSMWECEECLYIEYSTRPYLDWYTELTKDK
jgi:hypothetical protein